MQFPKQKRMEFKVISGIKPDIKGFLIRSMLFTSSKLKVSPKKASSMMKRRYTTLLRWCHTVP